jgi:Rad3-related DNA helicase
MLDDLVASARSKDKNTLILTRSFEAAKVWSNVAAVASKREESEALIEELHSKRGMAIAVPRRYDGVDLPGEDCRILILDGLSVGRSDYDAWRMTLFR